MDQMNYNKPVKIWTPRRIFNYIGGALCLAIVCSMLVVLVFTFVAEFFDIELLGGSSQELFWSSISMYAVAFPIAFTLMSGIPRMKKEEEKKLSVLGFLGFFLVAFGFMFGTNTINVIYNKLIENILGENAIDLLGSVANTFDLVTVVCLVMVAPIMEELLFRKVILDRIRVYGDKFAIITTAVLFGLFHMNMAQFLYATALGLVLAYVTCYTNRIRYAILIHMLVNFFGGALSLYVAGLCSNVANILYYVGIYAIAIVGLIVFILNRKKIHFGDAKIQLEHAYETCFSSAWMLVYVIGCGIVILILLLAPFFLEFIISSLGNVVMNK